MSLYWYYFKSVGWKYGLIMLSFATVSEVFAIMDRMFASKLLYKCSMICLR